MVLGRRQLSASLHEEKYVIQDGRPKEDSPLDTSEKFINLCEACRKGDLKSCQELISMDGININARDEFDYTPLISVGTRCPLIHNMVLRAHRLLFVGIMR